VVYEADYFGFWLHDRVVAYGVHCIVTTPSLLPQEYGNRVKTDRRELLLIDEPSAGLAPSIMKQIYNLLGSIAESGTTILLVDQNIMKAVEVSDFMYLLEMGQIKQRGPKEDFEDGIREIIRDSLISR